MYCKIHWYLLQSRKRRVNHCWNASPVFLLEECSRDQRFSLCVKYLLYEVDLLILQDQTQKKKILSVSLPYTCQKHIVLLFLCSLRCWSCIITPITSWTLLETDVWGSCLRRNCQLCQDRAITDALLNEKQNKTETH